MLPITIQSPYRVQHQLSDIQSHISPTYRGRQTQTPHHTGITAIQSPQQDDAPQLTSHCSSPITRLIIDDTLLDYLYITTNGSYKLGDMCILLKKSKISLFNVDFKSMQEDNEISIVVNTILHQLSSIHPLYLLYISQINPTYIISYINQYIPTHINQNNEKVEIIIQIILQHLSKLNPSHFLFHDVNNTPHLYLPCLLELQTDYIIPQNKRLNEKYETISKTPHALHKYLKQYQQVLNTSPFNTSSLLIPSATTITGDYNITTFIHPESIQYGLHLDKNDFWLLPIKSQYIPHINSLYYHAEKGYNNNNKNTNIPPMSITPSTSTFPVPAIPQAVLHQLINNNNQLSYLSKQKTQTTNCDTVLHQLIPQLTPPKYQYSHYISTYGIFNVYTHRVATIGGQPQPHIDLSANAASSGQTPQDTTTVYTLPSYLLNNRGGKQEQSPYIAMKKIELINFPQGAPSFSDSSIPFAKWLNNMSLLYLCGHVSPPPTTILSNVNNNYNTAQSYTNMYPIPFALLDNSHNNDIRNNNDNNILFTTNNINISTIHQQYNDLIISLTNTIITSYCNVISDVLLSSNNIISLKRTIIPTNTAPKYDNRSNESIILSSYSTVYQSIISTLFSSNGKPSGNPVEVMYLLVNGSVGSGKCYFISQVIERYISLQRQQATQINYPVVVTFTIDQLRSLIYHKQTTTTTMPYFTSYVSDTNIIPDLETSCEKNQIASQCLKIGINLHQNVSLVQILFNFILSLLSHSNNLIMVINNIDLLLPLQTQSATSSTSSSIMHESDQDYSILYTLHMVKEYLLQDNNIFNQNTKNAKKIKKSFILYGTTSIFTSSIASTTLTPMLHPYILSLFNNNNNSPIVNITLPNQQERFLLLQFYLGRYLEKFEKNPVFEKSHVLRRYTLLLQHISSITQSFTPHHLELIISRSLHSHNSIRSGDEFSLITPISLLYSTQSVQALLISMNNNIGSDQSVNKTSIFETTPTSLLHLPNLQEHDVHEYNNNKNINHHHNPNTIIKILHQSGQILTFDNNSQNNNNPQDDRSFNKHIIYNAFHATKQIITLLTSHHTLLPLLQRTMSANNNINLLQWIPTGMLLTGPRSSGKTFLLKIIIEYVLRLPCIYITQKDIISSFVGESEANIKNVFYKAQTIKPCVIFFDDIHQLVQNKEKKKRTKHDGSDDGDDDDDDDDDDTEDSVRSNTSLLTEMLTGLDQRHDNSNNLSNNIIDPIYIIATATSVQKVPTSLLSRGRFDVIADIMKQEVPQQNTETNGDLSNLNKNISLSPTQLIDDILSRKFAQSNNLKLCKHIEFTPEMNQTLASLPMGKLYTFILTAVRSYQQRILFNPSKMPSLNEASNVDDDLIAKSMIMLFGERTADVYHHKINKNSDSISENGQQHQTQECNTICHHDIEYAFSKIVMQNNF